MEKYLDWIIDEHRVSKGFFMDDALVKLEAEVYPDFEALYTFLKENGMVSTPFSRLKDVVKCSMNGYFNQTSLSSSEIKDLGILVAMAEFCNLKKYKIEKSARAILSIDSTGDSRTKKRAINKIKEWIRSCLPNLRKELVTFLKTEKLLPEDAKIFCDILYKDL